MNAQAQGLMAPRARPSSGVPARDNRTALRATDEHHRMEHPMSQPGTISLERPTPKIATITFSNPPVNLVVGETVTRLHELVAELGDDPGIQVVVFKSGVPDFFLNHFDLAAAADFPVPEGNDAVPIWTDVVLRLTKAPYITIASIRGRTRGGGNELALACDLRYASREKAMFGQPEVGGGLLPGGGGTERLPRFAGRDRALEIILSSSDYDAGLAERWGWVTRALPDAELDDFVDTMAARLLRDLLNKIENQDDHPLRFDAHLLRMGDHWSLLAATHELFAEYQLMLDKAAPTEHNMMLAYTNGCESYIPMDRDLALGDMKRPLSQRTVRRFDIGTAELFGSGFEGQVIEQLRSLWA